jgi:hypothetical protein
MSKRGIGYAVANGSSIKTYGEKKSLSYTEDGESASMRAQWDGVKKALCSAHDMNLRGNTAVQDGSKNYMQNKENGQRARINHEEGQIFTHLRVPAKEKDLQQETEKALKDNRFSILAAEGEQVFRRRA